MSIVNHVRSASYPPAQSNSKHVLKLMEQQIKDLQKLEASSSSPMETLRIGFSGLASLYKLCTVHDAVVFQFQNQQPGPPIVQVADICSSSRDLVLSFRQGVSELLVTSRSSESEVDADRLVSSYLSLRKQTARTAREVSISLRHLESSLVSLYNDTTNDSDETHLMRLLECVSIINISVLDSLLRLLALPLSKLTKKRSCFSNFSLVSKFRKPQGRREGAEMIKMGNELYSVDVALRSVLFSDTVTGTALTAVCQRLEVLQNGLEGIEDSLANIASHLSLLRSNLFS